jgi:branched-chain amino acid transport system ATP-binding protein
MMRRRGVNEADHARSQSSLVLESVGASYGVATALTDISMALPPGKAIGIVGENGAGKSTLLRSIARVHRRATGRITFGDVELLPLRSDQVHRTGVHFVREGAQVFEKLTIEEHILMAGRARIRSGVRRSFPPEWLDAFPILVERGLETKAGLLSGGQRQLLSLAMAFVARPEVLLLDEPSAGLSETTAAEVFEVIRNMVQTQGLSLLIAEQDNRWLKGLVDEAWLLEMGRLCGRVVLEPVAAEPQDLTNNSLPSQGNH